MLKHLDIQPGGRIKRDLLPDGKAGLRADQPDGSWTICGTFLAGKGNGVRLLIEEINDAIAEARRCCRDGRDG